MLMKDGFANTSGLTTALLLGFHNLRCAGWKFDLFTLFLTVCPPSLAAYVSHLYYIELIASEPVNRYKGK